MSPVHRLCRHFLDQRAGKGRLSQDNTLGSFQRSVSSFRNQSSAQPDHSELVLRVRFMFRFDWHCIQLPVQCYSEDTREQGDIFCKASGCQHGPFTGVFPLDHCTEHASTHTARFPLLSQAGGWLLRASRCLQQRAGRQNSSSYNSLIKVLSNAYCSVLFPAKENLWTTVLWLLR